MWAHLPLFGPLIWPSLMFDLDRCDLWPWTVRPWPRGHMTSTLIKALENNVWHLTLTYVTFDLDLRDLWPWRPLIFRSHVKYNMQNPRKSRFLTWWPWPLSYDLDLLTWPRYHQCFYTYPPKCGSHTFLSWLFMGRSQRNRAWRWAFGPLWEEKYNGPVTLTTVAMVMKKLSHGSDIDLMVTKLCIWCLLNHTNLLAENEQNLPHGFRDRPLATAWQPTSKWYSRG